MAAKLVTQELVDRAAEELRREGQEPTIILVQERVGGGSYTTVKKHLDLWKTARQQPPLIDVPEVVTQHGTAFIAQLWAQAADLAAQQTAKNRTDAAREVTELQQQLAEAYAAIARTEAALEAASSQADDRQAALTAAQQELAETQTARRLAEVRADQLAHQVADVGQQLQAERDALAQARADQLAQARLMGELAALRERLADQAQLIERLSGG